MKITRHSHKGNMIHNEKTGFFEVWKDGRRLYEITTTEEEAAVGAFRAVVGETWESRGEQGRK